jgi:hypothetical protein
MPEPRRIERDAVYGLESAREALNLRENCLSREIRLGRLRASKRGKRIMILGSWLIQWIESGEVKRGQKPKAVERNGTH